jgi:hypothetical protein
MSTEDQWPPSNHSSATAKHPKPSGNALTQNREIGKDGREPDTLLIPKIVKLFSLPQAPLSAASNTKPPKDTNKNKTKQNKSLQTHSLATAFKQKVGDCRGIAESARQSEREVMLIPNL